MLVISVISCDDFTRGIDECINCLIQYCFATHVYKFEICSVIKYVYNICFDYEEVVTN